MGELGSEINAHLLELCPKGPWDRQSLPSNTKTTAEEE
jgi:hypothetical protein